MVPQPLHPAVVHFPIVLGILLPIVTIVAVIAVRRGARLRSAWLPVVAIAAGLAASSWMAIETGEREEEVVEEIVAESALGGHEETAELFFALTILAAGLAAGGLLRGQTGSILRSATLVAALALMVAGYRVGHSGGELVYEHGAANAYVGAGAAATGNERQAADREDRHDR